MDKGMDFLRSQVNNAVAQHQSFVDSLVDHEREAKDPRFRDLCSRHIPMMREHQRMLEQYQQQLGAQTGVAKKMLGRAMAVAKDLADVARESDFLRLVSDIVMARQAEDTFKTFREAGRDLGNEQLRQLGEVGEQHHDVYVKEANRLCAEMFVEHVRADEVVTTRVETRTTPGA